MFCISMNPNHLNLIKELGYIPVGLGENKFSNEWYRDKESEIGIIWNDKNLKIKWPKIKAIISKKDKNNISFEEFIKKFKF